MRKRKRRNRFHSISLKVRQNREGVEDSGGRSGHVTGFLGRIARLTEGFRVLIARYLTLTFDDPPCLILIPDRLSLTFDQCPNAKGGTFTS